mgnify:CR=1 FL=1
MVAATASNGFDRKWSDDGKGLSGRGGTVGCEAEVGDPLEMADIFGDDGHIVGKGSSGDPEIIGADEETLLLQILKGFAVLPIHLRGPG